MFFSFFFSSIYFPITLNFFIAIFKLECASYNSYIEEEFEDDETANQQENEENNFLVGSQNILNSLRE